MSEGEAEKKKIADLYFNVDTKSLETINTELNQINENILQLRKKEISLKFNIDTSSLNSMNSNVDKAFSKIEKDNKNTSLNIQEDIKEMSNNYSKELQKMVSDTTNSNNQIQAKNKSLNNYLSRATINVAETKEKQAIRTTAAIERENAKQLSSHKTLYDQINSYAKTYLIYEGFNALKNAAKELINEMVEVEYQMVSIDRVLNDSSLNINNYRDQLIQLAYDYGNSFENVADVTLRLAQAGFDAQESLQLTEKTLLALNTAELNATQATDDMVAIMAQWGVTSGTAAEKSAFYGETIDKINKVADNFPTTSADILDALKKTSSAFNLAGASIDETIALITTAEIASQRGGKAIGTAMSNIIQQLKDAGRLSTMEDLGIEVYTDETKQEFNSVIDIITQLSEKMQELKAAGKENSVEMQNLLEVFTVFRRNIGAGLLSGVAGEESTYNEVLKASINSLGYSLQENEKHLKTAKAAQAQFNAELLKLKTEVWDAGAEDVFREFLELGTNIVTGIKDIINTFGLLPTTIGTVTLAFSALNKDFRGFTYNSKTNSIELSGFFKKIKEGTAEIRKVNSSFKELKDGQISLTAVTGKSYKNWIQNAKATGSYASSLVTTTLKTVGLQVATIALNAALSLGLSVAITAVISLFDNLIHKEEKYIESINEQIKKTEENISNLETEKQTLEELIYQYEELNKKESRTPEENQKIYEIQLQINSALKEQNQNIDFSNLGYEEQLKKLKEITKEQLEQIANEKKKNLQLAQQGRIGVSGTLDPFGSKTSDIIEVGKEQDLKDIADKLGFSNFYASIQEFGKLGFEDQLKYLTEWEEALRDAGKSGTEAYEWVSESLETVQEQQDKVTQSTKDYLETMAEVKFEEMFLEDAIENAEQYQKVLEGLNNMQVPEGFEIFKETLISLIKEQFPELQTEVEALSGNFESATEHITSQLDSLDGLSNAYYTLQQAQQQYNSTGTFTMDMFDQLLANGGELLQYLTIQNGQLQINTQAMLNLAESKKVEAIQSLQAAQAEDIHKLAMGDVESMSYLAKSAIGQVGDNASASAPKMSSAAAAANLLAAGLQNISDAAAGELGEGVDPAKFQADANKIINAYQGIANSISNIKITSPTYNPQIATGFSGSGGSGSSYSSAAKKAQEEAKKAEEEAYNNRLDAFKNYVSDMEEEEQRWVKKQQELEQLSAEDMQYITQQRIKRYQSYLAQVKKMTWLNKEDRLELEKEYTQEIEDLKLDYIGYLKEALDEEIKAIEDANDKKIEAIEEEADKKIEALQKVEDENDRIRKKEEYEENRKKHLEDISYWEQRTGREAQEALKEAKENLEELDEEWEDQLEDWSIEDQIKAIEEQRDKQIAAIEEAEAKEIEALQKIYDEKVKLFSETGKIIYDNSIIQSKNLYNAYKKNFVDPLNKDLSKLNVKTSSSSSKKEYESYKIKSGDTLSEIAAKFGTTVSKIMSANPSIKDKNLIYAGSTIKIPKFHEGGIVGGNKEGFALLKPQEVVLKPEWADGINRLAKIAKQSTTNNNIINQGTTIEVKGDLVKVEASVKNKSDIDLLTRKLERMLTDKFNIKK